MTTREEVLDIGNEILELLEGKKFQIAVAALTGVMVTILQQSCKSENDLKLTGQEIGEHIAKSWPKETQRFYVN